MLIHSGNASPQFSALMARFAGLRLAGPEDTCRVADFFNSTAMSAGKMSVGFTRGSDFFALLALQAERYAALICEENGSIVGVGALSMRQAFVRGKLTPVGYLQDLRIAPNAKIKTRQALYSCFTEFVRLSPQLDDFSHCSLFLTAILDENSAARSALSRPSFPLEYCRLTTYRARLWPKAPVVGKIFPVRVGDKDGSRKKLISFYQSVLGGLAFDLTSEDITRLLPHAVPVTLEADNEILAACLLVNTDAERKLRVHYKPARKTFETAGTYITALRVNPSLSVDEKSKILRRLLSKALKTSLRLGGAFTGLIELQETPVPLSFSADRSSYSISGSLYRVFHSEHTHLPDFSSGFLRPAHCASFEWVFS